MQETKALVESLRTVVARLGVDGDGADAAPQQIAQEFMQQQRSDAPPLVCRVHCQTRQVGRCVMPRAKLVADDRAPDGGNCRKGAGSVGLPQFSALNLPGRRESQLVDPRQLRQILAFKRTHSS